MDTLPTRIPVIDDNWKAREGAAWSRVESADRSMLEEHVDTLVCSQVDAIADALQASGVLEEETRLIVLGTQVDGVDVVLAEVDAENDVFRRLVLVENKLFRNAQAKRSVLAQVVEYGHVAQRTWPITSLAQLFRRADSAWLTKHHADVVDSLRRGEYLLLVVGDRIDRNLARLARRFVAQESALNLSELAILSLGIYRRGDERLVIPHVVSAVTVGERTLTIQVKVEDSSGRELSAVTTARDDIPLRSKEEGAPEGASDFLRSVAVVLTPEMAPNGWEVTKQPRKQLGYSCEYEDADPGGGSGTRAWFVVHFGGYEAGWRPLLVGLELTAKSTADRDAYKARFDVLAERGCFPDGTRVTTGGPVTVRVLAHIAWEKPEELNAGLRDRVVRAFRRLVEELVPILDEESSEHPA